MQDKKIAIYVICGILSVYFLFTSGLVYNIVSGASDTIDTPYSLALSKDDGIVGIYTDNDIRCAKWLAENHGDMQIYADYNGIALLMEYTTLDYLMYGGMSEKLEAPSYVFLSEWNIKKNQIVIGYCAALRRYGALPDLSNAVEVHRCGNAVVYKVGE